MTKKFKKHLKFLGITDFKSYGQRGDHKLIQNRSQQLFGLTLVMMISVDKG